MSDADASTEATCAHLLEQALESVRDLLDGSEGRIYVAPQNRSERGPA